MTDNPTPTPPPGRKINLSKDMTTMETSITDLQGELDVANKPSLNHFKPGWLIISIVVAVLVGGSTFFVVDQLTRVDENSKAIDLNCQLRNHQLVAINEKFQHLNDLVVARLKDRPDGSPNPPDVLAAFDKLRAPIPLEACIE